MLGNQMLYFSFSVLHFTNKIFNEKSKTPERVIPDVMCGLMFFMVLVPGLYKCAAQIHFAESDNRFICCLVYRFTSL